MADTSRRNHAKDGLISAFVQISIYLLAGLGFADATGPRQQIRDPEPEKVDKFSHRRINTTHASSPHLDEG
jgi:hypothetical protein